MAKESSYQRMKRKYQAEIDQLRKDIYTLIDDEKFVDVTSVKFKYKHAREAEKVIWAGDNPRP